MIPSSVASSEPPLTVTPTLEVLAIAVVEATLPIVTPSEPQGQVTTSSSTSQLANLVIETVEQTQTTSPPLPVTEGSTAQSSRSEDDAAQFQISHRISAPD